MCIFKREVQLEPHQKAYTSKKFTDKQKKEMFEKHSKELQEAKPMKMYWIDCNGKDTYKNPFNNSIGKFVTEKEMHDPGAWSHIFTKNKNVNLW